MFMDGFLSFKKISLEKYKPVPLSVVIDSVFIFWLKISVETEETWKLF